LADIFYVEQKFEHGLSTNLLIFLVCWNRFLLAWRHKYAVKASWAEPAKTFLMMFYLSM